MDCSMTSSVLSANYNTVLFEFGVTLVTSKILYALLRNVYQPRVFSDLLLGIILAQFRILSITNAINLVFARSAASSSPYLFARAPRWTLHDPRGPTADTAAATPHPLHLRPHALPRRHPSTSPPTPHRPRALRAFLAAANTASPSPAATDLKIAKTNAAAIAGRRLTSDMLTTLLIALGSMIWRDSDADADALSQLAPPPPSTAVMSAASAMAGWTAATPRADACAASTFPSSPSWPPRSAGSSPFADINMAAFAGLAFPIDGRLATAARRSTSCFLLRPAAYAAHASPAPPTTSRSRASRPTRASAPTSCSCPSPGGRSSWPPPWARSASSSAAPRRSPGLIGLRRRKMSANAKGYFHIYRPPLSRPDHHRQVLHGDHLRRPSTGCHAHGGMGSARHAGKWRHGTPKTTTLHRIAPPPPPRSQKCRRRVPRGVARGAPNGEIAAPTWCNDRLTRHRS
ncbi:hypothetical protein ZWY2020_051691 [Hordeum vulgare]|nr:hypothetical protein ZWY2020_051691 [Hordeum vulgare]